MNIQCARRGCRKKGVYRVALQKLADDGETFLTLQEWLLCKDDRDAVQGVIQSTVTPPVFVA